MPYPPTSPSWRSAVTQLQLSCLSLADLFADAIFLLIQYCLFRLGDVAAVLSGHIAFFLADSMVFLVQRLGLRLAHFAFFDFVLDTLVLVIQPVVDLFTARMILLPCCVGHCTAGSAGEHSNQCGENDCFS